MFPSTVFKRASSIINSPNSILHSSSIFSSRSQINIILNRPTFKNENFEFNLAKRSMSGQPIQKKLKVSIQSTQRIDPYIPQQNWSFPLSLSDWKDRLGQLTSFLMSRSAYVKIADALGAPKFFNKPIFLDEAKRIFYDVNNALASGDLVKLRPLVTESYLTELKPKLEVGQQANCTWNCSDVQMKVIKWRTFDGQQVGSHFAQVTVRFDTKQSLAVSDRNGVLITGSNEPTESVIQYWVFERFLKKDDPTIFSWRVMGLIPPPKK